MDDGGVLFIGALNCDTVAIGSVPNNVVDLVSKQQRYVDYSEMTVDDELAEEILVAAQAIGSQDQLGGSAFNVARVVSAYPTSLRLGYVGVSGSVDDEHPHIEALNKLGLETSFIVKSKSPPARSISFSADGDRTLFTSLGANAEAGKVLQAHEAGLAKYIASFDLVHITSFLDEVTPTTLANIVSAAVKLKPTLQVSIDPGHAWASAPTKEILRLIGQASILHLNSQEFAALGGQLRTEETHRTASRILNTMRADVRSHLVARTHKAIVIYSKLGQEVSSVRLSTDETVEASQVLDATGAGDTFTAGFLLMESSPVLRLLAATRFGSLLAQHKIQKHGPLDSIDVDLLVGRLVAGQVDLTKIQNNYE